MIDLRKPTLSLFLRYGKVLVAVVIFFLMIQLWVTNRQLVNQITFLRKENSLLIRNGETTVNKPSKEYQLPLQSRNSVVNAEIITGKEYQTEMDMPRFSMFTSEWIYLVEPGLGKRVVEHLFGSKKIDLMNVINFSNDQIKRSKVLKGQTSFMFGIVRHLPLDGMHYELIYKEKSSIGPHIIHKVSLLRPYGELMVLKPENSKPSESVFSRSFKQNDPDIHFVMALTADRLLQLENFIENHFNLLGESVPLKLTLSVFFEGKKSETLVDQFRNKIQKKIKELHYSTLSLTVIPIFQSNFSRGYGLHAGIAKIGQNYEGNSLIFTTDLDVVVTTLFLNRCRIHSEPGNRVYFPLVFSLYNPKIVSVFLNQTIPSKIKDKLRIKEETGWWRDFGYGMACFYK